jgi:hypothetical protein
VIRALARDQSANSRAATLANAQLAGVADRVEVLDGDMNASLRRRELRLRDRVPRHPQHRGRRGPRGSLP